VIFRAYVNLLEGNHLAKYESQWGWDYPIYEMENNFAMFETTKQKWSFSLG